MTNCNSCGLPIDWGYDQESSRWIPLEPVETHDDLPRSFVDENGELRAEHRARHGESSVNVTRLARKVQPLEAQARGAEIKRVEKAQQRRARRQAQA